MPWPSRTELTTQSKTTNKGNYWGGGTGVVFDCELRGEGADNMSFCSRLGRL